MPRCPHCGAEYQFGLLVCQGCGRSLSRDQEEIPLAEPPPPDPSLPTTEVLSRVPLVEKAVADRNEATPFSGFLAKAPFSSSVHEQTTEPLSPIPKPPMVTSSPSGAEFPAGSEPAPVETARALPHLPELAASVPLPEPPRPKLLVLRGERINVQYPIYEGRNFIGRTDEKPVDIDLANQEAPDRIWSSRQHAVITFEAGVLSIEDLNSLNGTFVNRTRVYPGQQRTLQVGDIIQIGTVQMKVVLG